MDLTNNSDKLSEILKNNSYSDDIRENLRCENHENSGVSSKYKIYNTITDSKEAEVYCLECKVCICCRCAMKYHISHINLAQYDLSEIFGAKEKVEWESAMINLEDSMKKSNFSRKMKEEISKVENENDKFIQDITTSVNSIKGKLDSFVDEIIKDYKTNIKQFIQENITQKHTNKRYKCLENTLENLSKIQSDWDKLSNHQKLELFKYKEKFKKDIDTFIKEINQVNVNFQLRPPAINENQKDRNNLKLKLNSIEEAAIELIHDIKKITSNINKQIQSYPVVQQNNVNPPSQKKEFNNIQLNSLKISPNVHHTNQIDDKSSILLGFTKNKFDEIYFVNSNSVSSDMEIKKISIPKNIFPINYKLEHFPLENSRYISFDNELIVTGGCYNNNTFENCYHVKLINNNWDEPSIIINEFPSMNKKRQRHNIIYLPHIKTILVCGGIDIQSCEIIKLSSNDKKWEFIPDMIISRTNATIFCVNDRYVYCIGNDKNHKNMSDDDISLQLGEFIDSYNFQQGWEFRDLKMYFDLCSLGVINKNRNTILLIGGFSQKEISNKIWEFHFDDNGEIKEINKPESVIELKPSCYFQSNQKFLSLNSTKYVNFDIICNLITFDPNTYSWTKTDNILART